jgi:hypothetical protein
MNVVFQDHILALPDNQELELVTQDISGRNIDPSKLTAALRMKFGISGYDVHVSVDES